jgi:hypothetical protein
MASTFHDYKKTRFWCNFEYDFELRATQMYEGDDDVDMFCMDTTTYS